MENTSSFSMQRVMLLSKRIVVLNYKPVIYVLLGFVVFFIISIMASNVDSLFASLTSFFTSFVLLYGATLMTAQIFIETQKTTRGIVYFSLPASTFEKFMSFWIVSFVGNLFMMMLIRYVSVLIQYLYPDNSSISLFVNVSKNPLLDLFTSYLVFHSVMMFGSVFFKTKHILKTVIVSLIIYLPVYAVFRVIYAFWEIICVMSGDVGSLVSQFKSQIDLVFLSDAKIVICSLIALVLWIATYYRLQEKEI